MNLIKNLILGVLVIGISPFLSVAQESGLPLKDTEARFFQAKGVNAAGKTVVILPGGGYSYHAMDHEGYDWVPFFNEHGVNVAVLKYKLPEGNPEIPLNDVKMTFAELHRNAGEWNIDIEDIGIMGFSAGGHLASSFATHAEEACKPAFQILFYPVISLKEGVTHQGSKDSLLGDNQSEGRTLMYSGEEQVTESTPPAIIFHSYDDQVVIENSINYFQALRKAGVPSSLHIYPSGGHGWGFREYFPYHDVMLQELSEWLKNQSKK